MKITHKTLSKPHMFGSLRPGEVFTCLRFESVWMRCDRTATAVDLSDGELTEFGLDEPVTPHPNAELFV